MSPNTARAPEARYNRPMASHILPPRAHFMYVLLCADGSLYTGYTVDVARRLAQHQAGRASKYTRTRRPVQLCGHWEFPERKAALQAEYAFKQLTRREKLEALAGADAQPPEALTSA